MRLLLNVLRPLGVAALRLRSYEGASYTMSPFPCTFKPAALGLVPLGVFQAKFPSPAVWCVIGDEERVQKENEDGQHVFGDLDSLTSHAVGVTEVSSSSTSGNMKDACVVWPEWVITKQNVICYVCQTHQPAAMTRQRPQPAIALSHCAK